MTFCFVDQVGSTAQLSALGDERGRQVRERLFDALREATAMWGGREVNFTGDGLFVAFDSALAGVDAAITMQQLVASLNRRADPSEHVAIRVGLHVGEALQGTDGYFGQAVVVAKRLCDAADAGQVLVSDLVRGLALPAGRHRFGSLGAMDLKGVSEPTSTYEVEWVVEEMSQLLPAALEVTGPMIGRTRELAAIDACFQAVGDGTRRAVVVTGVAGVGASRLLAEVAVRAIDRGVAVWFAGDGGSGGRFGLFRDALDDVARRTPRAELRLLVGSAGAELARIAPVLRERLPRLGAATEVAAGSEVFVVADALDECIVRTSQLGPLVVVLDGLDATDQDSLVVLRRLLTSRRPARALFVTSLRLDVEGAPGLLRELVAASDNLTEVPLRGLDAREVAEFLAVVSGDPNIDPATVASVTAETDGLPFYVTRMGMALRRDRVTRSVESAVQQAAEDRRDLQLRREEIGLGLRELASLRSEARRDEHEVEPDGTPPLDVPCPYRGLLPFSEAEADVFCGRDALVAELVARLLTHRFLAVVGPSGSGKSSLVHAGLLPALAAGAIAGADTWIPVTVTPGTDPLEALAGVLRRYAPGTSTDALVDRLRQEGLDTVVEALLPDRTLLLVVDQAEEVWTSGDPDQTAAFLALLAGPSAAGRLVTVVVLRADYYGHAADHPHFAAAVADSHVLVGPLSRAELREAVEQPAATVGLVVDPALTEAILEDAAGQPGALPLVSTALVQTWERRRGRSLTLAGYREAGGVRAALAHLADTTYDSFDPDEQLAARRLLLRLAAPGVDGNDVRRRLPLEQAAADTATRNVLAGFTDRRLLTTSDTTVEVAHEALLSAWPRLRAWLDADRDGRRLHHQIADAAHDWDTTNRDDSLLLRGARLLAANDWAASNPDLVEPLERTYLDASLERHTRDLRDARRTARRLRRLVAGLAAILVVALAATTVAYLQRRSTERAQQQAVARSLAAQAGELADTSIDTALLLAVEAHRRDPGRFSEAALLTSLNAARSIVRFHRELPSNPVAADMSADRRTLAVVTAERTMETWDTTTWERTRSVPSHLAQPNWVEVSQDGGTVLVVGTDSAEVHHVDGTTTDLSTPAILAIALSPDGALVAGSYGPDRHVGLWNASTGTLLSSIESPGTAVAFTDDGASLIVGDFRTKHLGRYLLDGSLQDSSTIYTGIQTVATSPGVVYVGGGDGSVRVLGLDLEERSVYQGLRGPVALLDIRPGAVLAVDGGDGRVRVLDPGTKQVLYDRPGLEGAPISATLLDAKRLLLGTQKGFTEITFGPKVALGEARDGDGAAVVGDRGPVYSCRDRLVPLDVADLAKKGPSGPRCAGPVLGGHGTTVVTASDESHVIILDVTGQKAPRRVTLPSPQYWGAVSPDGRQYASFGTNGQVDVVDTADGTIRAELDTGGLEVTGVAWTTDGEIIVAGGFSGVIRSWDASTGRRLGDRPSGGTGVYTLATDPHRHIAYWLSGVDELAAVDLDTGELVEPPRSLGSNRATAAAVSPDSKVLAVGDFNGLRLFDLETAAQIGPLLLNGAREYVHLEWAADGTRLISSNGGTVTSWDMEPASWERRACAIADRNLTKAEWAQHIPDEPYRATCTDIAR